MLHLALDDNDSLNQRVITISEEGDFVELYRNFKTAVEGRGHNAASRARLEGLRLDTLDDWPPFSKAGAKLRLSFFHGISGGIHVNSSYPRFPRI